jgi:hypothetical protein
MKIPFFLRRRHTRKVNGEAHDTPSEMDNDAKEREDIEQRLRYLEAQTEVITGAARKIVETEDSKETG